MSDSPSNGSAGARAPSGLLRRHGRWLVLAVALLLLAWLMRDLDRDAAWRAWLSVPAWVWSLMLAGLLASHLARAARIHNEWADRVPMRFRDAMALTVSHSAWVVIAPMRAGEAYYPLALRERYGIGLAESSLSLLRQRVQDLLALATIAACLLPLPAMVRIALFASAFAAVTLGARRGWQLLERWLPKLKRLSTLDDDPRKHLRRWLLTLINWVLKLAALAFPLTVMGGLGFEQAWRGAFGGEIAAALPLQPPAGFGPFEAGVWAGASAFAAPASAQVIVAALAVHLAALGFTLLLALLARASGWHLRPVTDNAGDAGNR
ncbi:MAG: hypothetical protein EBU07_07185 [Betaproteobacteria bacterium]|nr:hypothetical protein [Betaproteobacteria bacterium]NBS46363.1 hypothetical protein [Betaproteobacteria bacterium]